MHRSVKVRFCVGGGEHILEKFHAKRKTVKDFYTLISLL